jgi:hypothetical protein
MKGANKLFQEQKEQFLQKNLIVMQSSLQGQLFGWAQLNNALQKAQDVDEAHFATVWEFDLVKMPKLFDIVRAKGGGKAPDVYEVRLLDRIDNVPTKRTDTFGKPIVKGVTRNITKSTNRLIGYYCPWSGNRAWSVQLDNQADYFFTATLNGCTVAVEGGQTTRITHANYIDAATQIDQQSIDDEIARRHAGAIATVKKTDYTNVAKKDAARVTDTVLDYQACVVGFREKNGWHFYYQSYKKFQAASAKNPSVTLNHAVLRDRAVRLV